jgi:hypothetical protein
MSKEKRELARLEICMAFQRSADNFSREIEDQIRTIKSISEKNTIRMEARRRKKKEAEEEALRLAQEEADVSAIPLPVVVEKKVYNKALVAEFEPFTIKKGRDIIEVSMKLSTIDELEELPDVIRVYAGYLETLIKEETFNLNPLPGSMETFAAEVARKTLDQIQICKSLLHIYQGHPDNAIKRAKELLNLKKRTVKNVSMVVDSHY